MDAEATIRTYYDTLRDGEPLFPFFAREETTVKFGIGERLRGFSAIEDGLSAQTETTAEWRIDSDRLLVTEREAYAWFSDDVFMAWTDLEAEDADEDGSRREFETRWSGTLERRPGEPWTGSGPATPWRFVGMHVSAPGGSE